MLMEGEWWAHKYGWMDGWVSDGQNADVVWWCWFPGRAFLNEFSQWLPLCMVIQCGSVWYIEQVRGKHENYCELNNFHPHFCSNPTTTDCPVCLCEDFIVRGALGV